MISCWYPKQYGDKDITLLSLPFRPRVIKKDKLASRSVAASCPATEVARRENSWLNLPKNLLQMCRKLKSLGAEEYLLQIGRCGAALTAEGLPKANARVQTKLCPNTQPDWECECCRGPLSHLQNRLVVWPGGTWNSAARSLTCWSTSQPRTTEEAHPRTAATAPHKTEEDQELIQITASTIQQ
jgi:hypothetical protein